MADLLPQNQVDAVISSAPSYDFRTTPDTTKYTKAIMLTLTSETNTAVVQNEIVGGLGGITTLKVGTSTIILPLRTKTAVTSATYTAYYLY